MKKHLCILAGLATALTTLTGTASADNTFSLHLEPGVVVPLTAPQSNGYNPGMVLGAKGMFAVDPHVSIGPSVSSMYLPRSGDSSQNAGVMWQFGGSVRVQGDRRTSSHQTFGFLNPWVDGDLSVADTGGIVRPAFDVGLGAEVPLDQNHIAWMGPFVRFTHMFQTSSEDNGRPLDPRDVNLLQVGISVSFDTPTTPRTRVVRHETVRVERQVVRVPVTVVRVTPPPPAKVDLSERVFFDSNSSALHWESRDKLDALVKELKQHPSVTIRVQGHASADGPLSLNKKLAASRVDAVVKYLTSHGVDSKRLHVESFGVTHPAAPNSTKEGRERNRRVEFRDFISIETK